MPPTPMTPMKRILRQWESPPTWLLLMAGLALMQARLVPVRDAGGLGDWLGLGFILAGAALLSGALVQFKRARTTVLPRETARVLITAGVYRFSRNPIYLADALILTGLCLTWDLGALIWVPVVVIVIDQRFIEAEEAALRAGFGPAFDDWSDKVPRWL